MRKGWERLAHQKRVPKCVQGTIFKHGGAGFSRPVGSPRCSTGSRITGKLSCWAEAGTRSQGDSRARQALTCCFSRTATFGSRPIMGRRAPPQPHREPLPATQPCPASIPGPQTSALLCKSLASPAQLQMQGEARSASRPACTFPHRQHPHT